jgi:hypothetical protein
MIFALLTLHHTLVIGAVGLLICALSDSGSAVKSVRSRFEKLSAREEPSSATTKKPFFTDEEGAAVTSSRLVVSSPVFPGSAASDITSGSQPSHRKDPLSELPVIDSRAENDASVYEESVSSDDTASWTLTGSLSSTDDLSDADSADELEKGQCKQRKVVAPGQRRMLRGMDGNPVLSLITLFVSLFQFILHAFAYPLPLECRQKAALTVQAEAASETSPAIVVGVETSAEVALREGTFDTAQQYH